MRKSLLAVIAMLITFSGFGQNHHTCSETKTRAYQRILKKTRAGAADNVLMAQYDVNWYFLDLNIERNTTVLSGNVTIGATTLLPTDTFCFELNSTMTIDSVVYQNVSIPFTHTNSSHICYAKPTTTIPANIYAEMKIYYHGDASVVGGSAIGDGFIPHFTLWD